MCVCHSASVCVYVCVCDYRTQTGPEFPPASMFYTHKCYGAVVSCGHQNNMLTMTVGIVP